MMQQAHGFPFHLSRPGEHQRCSPERRREGSAVLLLKHFLWMDIRGSKGDTVTMTLTVEILSILVTSLFCVNV